MLRSSVRGAVKVALLLPAFDHPALRDRRKRNCSPKADEAEGHARPPEERSQDRQVTERLRKITERKEGHGTEDDYEDD